MVQVEQVCGSPTMYLKMILERYWPDAMSIAAELFLTFHNFLHGSTAKNSNQSYIYIVNETTHCMPV